jgi:hypothetical protein
MIAEVLILTAACQRVRALRTNSGTVCKISHGWRRSSIRRVSSSCRFNCTMVYSSVIVVLAGPAILLASMLLPPTSCPHAMLARRNECRPRRPSPAAKRPDISSYRKLSRATSWFGRRFRFLLNAA